MPPTLPRHGGPSKLGLRYRPPIPTKGRGKVHPMLGTKRHRKILKDTVRAITNGDIRRLARRGGVKRISGMIYDDIRAAMKARLIHILKDCALYVEYRKAKTVTVHDVIYALKRIGNPVWGFDPETSEDWKKRNLSLRRR